VSGFLTDAASLIVQVVFGLYILAVLLRFVMQLTRADFYNPIAQFVVTLTNPPLKPLRRLIPGLFGIDVASLLLLFALQYLEIATLLWIRGVAADPLALLLPTVIELVRLTIYVFLFAILIRVVLSWVSPYGLHQNPAGSLLISLSEPLLRPARRWIPAMGGLDLSPIAVLVLLQLLLLALNHLLR
jgi:YggT family protein